VRGVKPRRRCADRLGKTAALRFGQRIVIRRARFHLREHEVGRAVHHAADLENRFVRERGSNARRIGIAPPTDAS